MENKNNNILSWDEAKKAEAALQEFANSILRLNTPRVVVFNREQSLMLTNIMENFNREVNLLLDKTPTLGDN